MSLLNLVVCGGLPLPPRAPAGTLELDTSNDAPGAKRVFLKLDPLTERLVDDLDPVMADAVEIASYVFTSDKLIQRGSPQMHRMGGDWRRRFRFIIPVRKREILHGRGRYAGCSSGGPAVVLARGRERL